jgi:hypothetical protein
MTDADLVQFAYHETSYFLIRLLQEFSEIILTPHAQPPETLPPPEWKNATGTKSDSLRPKAQLTMSIMVRDGLLILIQSVLIYSLGWLLGYFEGIRGRFLA